MTSASPNADFSAVKRRVLVVGGTGYIGKHVVRELVARGHDVVCFVRRRSGVGGVADEERTARDLEGAEIRFGDVTDAASVGDEGFRGETFDVVVSCLASRTGAGVDAWKIDQLANLHVLEAGIVASVKHFILLSAICVQKPTLEFQKAKLAFEKTLIESSLDYSIVRPTAFFKSLSGQIERVKSGKPFLVFGNGELTSCKPISEADLARFLADCLDDPKKRNAILPIGGPGSPITPKNQGEMLFDLCEREKKFRHVPVSFMSFIIATLALFGRVIPKLRDKAELARIGRYYGTESMLVLDPLSGKYDADATPSYGEDTLRDFYIEVLKKGLAGQELGDQAVFSRPRS